MRYRRIVVLLLLIVASLTGHTFGQLTQAPQVKDAALGNTRNVHACGKLFLAGQPMRDDIVAIKDNGVQRVITLRTNGEVDWDEAAAIKDAGLEFVEVPFGSPDSLTDNVFDKVRKLLNDSDKTSTLLHCGSANRVGAVWLTHRVLDQRVPLETAVKEAKTIGLRTAAFESKALDYIKRRRQAEPASEQSVRPGINDNFLKADLDVAQWLGRFEVESREVFGARNDVVKACGVRSGSRVADIGAGTGFFTRLFAEAAGADGWVFAVDISARFLEHIRRQAEDDRVTNVTGVLCSQRSIALPPNSIDLAFVCDTYHHFEYPQSTLASIHRALRQSGTLVVIDFERLPGNSREFIMSHVRAGKRVFRGEIELAGFEFVEEIAMERFRENYFLRFRKKAR